MSKKLSRAERKERPMLKAIQDRYNREYPVSVACVKTETKQWNKVCDLMITEMTEEGLTITAELIKEFKK